MLHPNDWKRFTEAFEQSLTDDTFVTCVLSKNKGKHKELKKVTIRKIDNTAPCSFIYSYLSKDVTKNYSIASATDEIEKLIANGFNSTELITTNATYLLLINAGKSKFKKHNTKAEIVVPSRSHNREKQYVIDFAILPFFVDLGLYYKSGEVIKDHAGKVKQLQNLIKLLDKELERINISLGENETLEVVDMGCGKGYLTFLLYYYFNVYKKIKTKVTGVDRNSELIEMCNSIAKANGFTGLTFVESSIKNYTAKKIDILFALHACDTGTDEALWQGITKGAELIFSVPCCQKELRPQFSYPQTEHELFKHDTYKDRFCQILTDGLRSLILENNGYVSRVIEFISDAHTHRNVMILARKDKAKKLRAKTAEINALMERYGIKYQKLMYLL